jgi:hypothetical protein
MLMYPCWRGSFVESPQRSKIDALENDTIHRHVRVSADSSQAFHETGRYLLSGGHDQIINLVCHQNHPYCHNSLTLFVYSGLFLISRMNR